MFLLNSSKIYSWGFPIFNRAEIDFLLYNLRDINHLDRKVSVKLNVKAFALAAGLVWGINWFILTWWMILFEGITHDVTLLGRWYRGFTVSPVGSLVALGYGFIDGALIGLLLAWLYNRLAPLMKSEDE